MGAVVLVRRIHLIHGCVVCAQKNNRQALIEGTLTCLQQRPLGEITARDIATASAANLASIGYHFGSKDALLVHALAEGFRQWTQQVRTEWTQLAGLPTPRRLGGALGILQASLEGRRHFVQAYVTAMSLAAYKEPLRDVLRDSLAEGRDAVCDLLDLGSGAAADDASALLIAAFDGALMHSLVTDVEWLEPGRFGAALARLIAAASTWK